MSRSRLTVAAATAAVCLLLLADARAQSLPRLTAPVNDFAHVIDSESARELDRRIRELEAKTHDAVVVATVETIAPYGSIEEYALKLFEQSGIGQRERNNGVLIVVAKNERRVRIEVGYDLEEFVTDGFSGDIIRQQFLPAFRYGAYGIGLVDGATRIINRIAEGRGVVLDNVPKTVTTRSKNRKESPLSFLPIVLIILFVILAARRSRGRGFRGPRFPWGGFGGPFGGFGGGLGGFGGGGGGFGGGFGGGGGGFGGFGGGRSGGGGASGGW